MTVEIITAILLAALVAAIGYLIVQIQEVRAVVEPLATGGIGRAIASIR